MLLKTPGQGGTKKEYEDFIEKIHSHMVVQWGFGSNIGYVIKKLENPAMKEPAELTEDQEKSKVKVRLWNSKVDWYAAGEAALEENKVALFSLMTNVISKIMKRRLRGNEVYRAAEDKGDVLWLFNALDEIVVRFEEVVKPKTLSIDDQMERIMKMKQVGSTTNEDFIKKYFEKSEGLWETRRRLLVGKGIERGANWACGSSQGEI